jgi:hypothetical protein
MPTERGISVTHRTLRHLGGYCRPYSNVFALPVPYLVFIAEDRLGHLVGGALSISLLDFRTATALAAVAVVTAGCAATNNATSSQGEQPYKTGYGLTSDGPTTNLYTELFGSGKTATSPSTATTQQGQSATETASTRQPQPGTPTVSAQPRPPSSGTTQPPPEPDIPVAYGITANGPTTDLFTELFGPTRRDGQ